MTSLDRVLVYPQLRTSRFRPGDVCRDEPGPVAAEQMRLPIWCSATLLKFNFAPWE
jgi:hypothetical protein